MTNQNFKDRWLNALNVFNENPVPVWGKHSMWPFPKALFRLIVADHANDFTELIDMATGFRLVT